MWPRPTRGSRRRKKIMRKAIGVVVTLALIPILTSCRPTSLRTVVVYVSEDQVFSEPILKDFERDTGITVKSVFDTEESKSTGVMNRLIAEKDNPQADVYWANEPVRLSSAVCPRRMCQVLRKALPISSKIRIITGPVFLRARACCWSTQDRQSNPRASWLTRSLQRKGARPSRIPC